MNSLTNSNSSPDSLPLPPLEAILEERRRRASRKALKEDHDAIRRRCATFHGFIREAWPILEPSTPFIDNWHIALIAAHLEAITRGTLLKLGLKNLLIINEPPGMMKSLEVSVFWNAWEWGPCGLAHLRYLTTSYSEDNIERDNRKVRDLVESEWFRTLWPDCQLKNRGVWNFSNTAEGGREGRAFGSMTGGRGNRVILDDPHSTESAESEADRKVAKRIVRESLHSRVNDLATDAIVVIMQRLREDDVSGVLIELGLGYTHIMLPMRFEPDRAFKSPLGPKWNDPRTKAGELMFPGKFPLADVNRLELAMGSVGTAGQYQQRPAPRGGIVFQRHHFKVVDAVPAMARRVRGWDFAASTEEGSPYTCGVKLSRDPFGMFYVEDVRRARVSNPEPMVVTTAEQDGKGVEIDIPQDPGAAGKVQKQGILARLAGWLAYGSPESGDKVTRAMPVAAQAEAGNFRIVKGPWNDSFLNEIETFPNSTFKDQVDALSRAFGRHISTPAPVTVVPLVVTSQREHFGDNVGG